MGSATSHFAPWRQSSLWLPCPFPRNMCPIQWESDMITFLKRNKHEKGRKRKKRNNGKIIFLRQNKQKKKKNERSKPNTATKRTAKEVVKELSVCFGRVSSGIFQPTYTIRRIRAGKRYKKRHRDSPPLETGSTLACLRKQFLNVNLLFFYI